MGIVMLIVVVVKRHDPNALDSAREQCDSLQVRHLKCDGAWVRPLLWLTTYRFQSSRFEADGISTNVKAVWVRLLLWLTTYRRQSSRFEAD